MKPVGGARACAHLMKTCQPPQHEHEWHSHSHTPSASRTYLIYWRRFQHSRSMLAHTRSTLIERADIGVSVRICVHRALVPWLEIASTSHRYSFLCVCFESNPCSISVLSASAMLCRMSSLVVWPLCCWDVAVQAQEDGLDDAGNVCMYIKHEGQ